MEFVLVHFHISTQLKTSHHPCIILDFRAETELLNGSLTSVQILKQRCHTQLSSLLPCAFTLSLSESVSLTPFPSHRFGAVILTTFCPAGMFPLPWTINGEIYPLWARSFCYSTATSFNWLFNFAVSVSFLSLSSAITKHGSFYLYAGITVLGWIFFYFMLPETTGRTLEEASSFL